MRAERPAMLLGSQVWMARGHEQAIARFGLRHALPRGLEVIMGPGCPVCVTDAPEVDEAIALAESGLRVLTYGDMLRVPGTSRSLADARAAGARVDVVYSVTQAVERGEEDGDAVAGRAIVYLRRLLCA